MLKGVLGHADLAVPVDGRNRQVGNALGLQVKRHSIPGGDAALELELDGRGPRQIDHHALAHAGHADGLARVVEQQTDGPEVLGLKKVSVMLYYTDPANPTVPDPRRPMATCLGTQVEAP